MLLTVFFLNTTLPNLTDADELMCAFNAAVLCWIGNLWLSFCGKEVRQWPIDVFRNLKWTRIKFNWWPLMWAPTANNLKSTFNNSWSIPSPELIENMAHLCGFFITDITHRVQYFNSCLRRVRKLWESRIRKMHVDTVYCQWRQFMIMLFVAYVHFYFQLIDLREYLKSLNSKC